MSMHLKTGVRFFADAQNDSACKGFDFSRGLVYSLKEGAMYSNFSFLAELFPALEKTDAAVYGVRYVFL